MTPDGVASIKNIFEQFADLDAGSFEDFKDVRSILEVILGFANATQITFGDNRTECQMAAERLYYSAERGFIVITGRWFNWFDFWFSFDYFLNVPYNLYTLQYSCTESYYEVVELFQTYTMPLRNMDMLLFNLFYSGGNIIKSIVNISMYFIAKKYTRVYDAFTLGMELG